LKAGLLDRAEAALLKLEGTPFEAQARLALLANYERSRDWPQAALIAQKLTAAGQGNFDTRLAHYLCEQADACLSSQDSAQALALLHQAVATAPEAPRARINLAQLLASQGKVQEAYAALELALQTSASAVPLIAIALAKLAIQSGHTAQTLKLLKSHYEAAPSLDVLDAIVALEATLTTPAPTARDWYVRHLEHEPSLVAAAKWIAGEKLEHEQFHPQVQRALDHAVKPLMRYRCAACGFEAKQHFWQCPGCQAWDSYPARRVEEL
jgi:lipopolysaccharide biosynthesis regulator YciM